MPVGETLVALVEGVVVPAAGSFRAGERRELVEQLGRGERAERAVG
jgi:hypothetical protein